MSDELGTERLEALMETAIRESLRSRPEDGRVHPRVGAVIADASGKIIAKAHRGEHGNGEHAEYLAIEKAKTKGFEEFESAYLFATLEPCTHRSSGKTPCAQRIVEAGFRKIYIGCLDPNPTITTHGEVFLRSRFHMDVERFPSRLTAKIMKINSDFEKEYSQSHLPSNSVYIQKRVSEIVLLEMKKRGVDLRAVPSEEMSLADLAAFAMRKSNKFSASEIANWLHDARALAFDEKYCAYEYRDDARSIENKWRREVPGILAKRFQIFDYQKRRILNVGIGNGLEAVGLFDGCPNFVGVDIAKESLKRAQRHVPKGTLLECSAEKLTGIGDEEVDIYVSLRTYQSAFFDIQHAVREAYRVVAPGGIVIVSVANAYIDGRSFIKGLLPHGSKFVDQNLAHSIVDGIRRQLLKMGFEETGVHSGKAEEYVFGRKR